MCGNQASCPADQPDAAGWLRGEPLLDELLADPVLGSLLRSDGVDPVRFRTFLDELRRNARARRQRDRADDFRDLARSLLAPGGR
ncbi:MAG TPA: hypothetical protein VHT04_15385 [Stellaceae bacterium]|nr:hypothetical protein [Stellaceae bacterium]